MHGFQPSFEVIGNVVDIDERIPTDDIRTTGALVSIQ